MNSDAVKVLVTGATGFLGSALLKRLCVEKKFDGLGSVRREIIKSDLTLVRVGTLSADTDWTPALAGVKVVIHTAARVHVMKDELSDSLAEYRRSNVDGTLALARQAVEAGVRRFIFISTIKVNGEQTEKGIPYSADDVPLPTDPYGISKKEAEEKLLLLVKEAGMELVIIRPPLVYGPGVKANFASMVNLVKRGVPLPLGLVKNKRSMVAIDNLVDLILTCVEHPNAKNEVFLAGDGDDLSVAELLTCIGQVFGKPARLLPVPVFLLKFSAKIIGKSDMATRILGALQVDISKNRELLEWRPPFTLQDQLKKMI